MAAHMHEALVLLFCCGVGDWPFNVPAEQCEGLAPPSHASIYPCVQNILLACRGLGLGASLTTMHQMFEAELHTFFGVPPTHGVVAVIPIGFPMGKCGPLSREPVETKTHFKHWGGAKSGLASPAT